MTSTHSRILMWLVNNRSFSRAAFCQQFDLKDAHRCTVFLNRLSELGTILYHYDRTRKLFVIDKITLDTSDISPQIPLFDYTGDGRTVNITFNFGG